MLSSIKIDLTELERNLPSVKKQIHFAASQALNTIAYQVARNEMPKKTNETFQGGATRFTQTGFKYIKSNKTNLTAYVFIDPTRADYMKFMVQGGTRFPKKRAIIVATRHSKLNRYGNIPRGTLSSMIEDKSKFFKGIPKGRHGANYEGIWERYGRQSKAGGQRIRMVAQYTDKAQYKPLFPFGTFVEGVVFSQNKGFVKEFRKRLKVALQNAK